MAVKENSTEEAVRTPIVIDLGKKNKKQVRRLRKGRGKLTRDMVDAIDDLVADGQISGNVQPIIVTVRQKRRRGRYFF